MKITLKLYASLSEYLPSQARDNTVEIDVPSDASPLDILNRFQVPLAEIHLVLVNGIFVPPGKRETALAPGDSLAIWPAVAGG